MGDPEVGTLLGEYVIAAPLGAGGNGSVWRADGPGGPAAVKVLRASGPRAREALRREVGLLARLRHPGVPRLLASDLGVPVPWVAMELVEGEPFDRWLAARGPVAQPSSDATWTGEELGDPEPAPPPAWPAVRAREEALAIVGQVARVLAWLHGEGVVHRDVKPANVVLRADGRPVLVDFGMGFDGGARERLGGDVRGGTLAYASPEQIAGRPPDARADLYALGCVLHEVLAGAPPFRGSPRDVLLAHRHSPPPELGDEVPEPLRALVRRLLAKEPSARLAWADEVATVLGVPPSVPPPRVLLHRPDTHGMAEALDALDAGRGVRFVVGPAGSGKTRLASEAVARARAMGVRCVTGSGPDGLGAVVRDLVALERSVPVVASAVAAGRPVLAELVPELGPAAPALEREAQRTRTVCALCETLAAAAPVLAVLDDVRDTDDLALALLEAATVRAWPPGVRLIATARDDEPGARLQGAVADAGPPLRLAPLPAPELRRAAADLLGEREIGPGLATVLVPAPGTPSELVERVHALVEEGWLRREQGAWVGREAPTELCEDRSRGERSGSSASRLVDLPRTAPELVRWRVSRLPGPARAAAETLALLDTCASAEVVAATCDDGLAGLAELHRRHLLVEEGWLARRHREAVLEALPPERGAVLARRALRALPDAPAGLRLALLERAGDRVGARAAALEAVAEARRDTSVVQLGRWLADLVRLTDDPLERARARIDLAEVLVASGRSAEAIAELDRAEGALVDPEDRVRWAIGLARARPDGRAVPLLRAMLDLATARRWEVLLTLGQLLVRLGRHAEASGPLLEAVASGPPARQPKLLAALASNELELGRPAAAERLLRSALTGDDPLHRSRVCAQLGAVLLTLGRNDDATATLLEALAAFRSLGQRLAEASVLNNLGSIDLRDPRAIGWLERAAALRLEVGPRGAVARPLGNLAMALAHAGRVAEAVRAMQTAVEAARAAGSDDRSVGSTLAQQANLLAQLRQPGAIAAADEAIARLEASGRGLWLPFALCARGLAELADGRSAAEWLARARAAAGDEPALLRDLEPLTAAQLAWTRARAGEGR